MKSDVSSLRIVALVRNDETTVQLRSHFAKTGGVSSMLVTNSIRQALRAVQTASANALLIDLSVTGARAGVDLIETLRSDYRNIPVCLVGKKRSLAELAGVPPSWKRRFAHYHKLATDQPEGVLAARVEEEVFKLGNWIRGRRFILLSEKTRDPRFRGVAFIMMAIDPANMHLRRVHRAVRETFASFSIRAVRGDEIEHQRTVTQVIIEHIQNCDLLFADLSYSRPNVYYEVGYAHALGRAPILVCREGEDIHFDLSVHNVPGYRDMGDLKRILRARLQAISDDTIVETYWE